MLPAAQQSLKTFVTKDNVIKAETLWTLKLVTNHYSFNSSTDTAKLFAAMFPDSEIAEQFFSSERMAAYMTVFGLAEHFKKFLRSLKRSSFLLSCALFGLLTSSFDGNKKRSLSNQIQEGFDTSFKQQQSVGKIL